MKLLLLDKDGTLTETRSGAKFVNDPWDQRAITGASEAIDRYTSEGWKPIIISNQGGVIAGHKSLESTISEMRCAFDLFPSIAEAYFCPDRGDSCWRVWREDTIEYPSDSLLADTLGVVGQFRKPQSGMLLLAIEIEAAEQVLYVGDRPEDEGAAIGAGVSFKWAEDWRSGT